MRPARPLGRPCARPARARAAGGQCGRSRSGLAVGGDAPADDGGGGRPLFRDVHAALARRGGVGGGGGCGGHGRLGGAGLLCPRPQPAGLRAGGGGPAWRRVSRYGGGPARPAGRRRLYGGGGGGDRDRKSVVSGKRWEVSVDRGGRRVIK